MGNGGQADGTSAGESRWLGGILTIIAVIALYYAIQVPSFRFGQENILGVPEAWVRNGAWLYMIQHHLAQMVLALLVIAVVGRMRFSDWGLNLRNWRRSLEMTGSFTVIFGIVIAVSTVLQVAGGVEPRSLVGATTTEVLGRLLFMLFISGLSEEVLFRGMMQTPLTRWFPGVARLGKLDLPVAGVITALIFAAVHVNFTLVPLAVTHLCWPQVILAFVLGVVYAVAYHRTGSLLAPVLMHNISNGLMAISPLVVAAFL